MSTVAPALILELEPVMLARLVILTSCPKQKLVTLVLPVQLIPTIHGAPGVSVVSTVVQVHKQEPGHVKLAKHAILIDFLTEKAVTQVLSAQLTHTAHGLHGGLAM